MCNAGSEVTFVDGAMERIINFDEVQVKLDTTEFQGQNGYELHDPKFPRAGSLARCSRFECPPQRFGEHRCAWQIPRPRERVFT